MPDDEPLKEYLVDKVLGNLMALDEVGSRGPLGVLWDDKRPENEFLAPQVWVATWEQNYLAWSIDHANDQGFAGGATHRDRIVAFQTSLFTSAEFDRRFAGAGVIAVGVQGSDGVKHYDTLTELFANNFIPGEDPTAFQGYYGVDARLALIIGIQNGLRGADVAYEYVMADIADRPYLDGVPDLAARSGWAIAQDGEV